MAQHTVYRRCFLVTLTFKLPYFEIDKYTDYSVQTVKHLFCSCAIHNSCFVRLLLISIITINPWRGAQLSRQE